jgi:citrate lyase subunit beta/citryl-CoA lyase
MADDALSAARTLLFVPGDRPDRFAKAGAAGADVVILDLEDAVAASRKDAARARVRGWFAAGGTGIVRVNGAGTPWHEADLDLAAALRIPVLLPKAEDPDDVARVVAALRGGPVIALVETAAGVLAAPAVCAVTGVVRPAFGNVDLAAELGVDPADHVALAHARQSLVLAAAAAGTAPPVDGVTTAITDDDALRDDLRHAVRTGFTGKLCIHPRQVATAREAFAPTPEQLAWARRVLAAAPDGAAAAVDGHMVDGPVLARARRFLAAGPPAHPTGTPS